MTIYRGHYYQRSGSTLQELKGAALDRFLMRRYGRTWDSVPVPGPVVADLSKQAIQAFRTLAAGSGRMDPAALNASDAGLVEKLKLTEGKYLTRAAVLLFHPDPQRYVTGAFAKIGFFRSESDLVYHDEGEGDLFNQVRQTMDLLLTKYLKASIRYEGIQRIERFPMPRAALREALLNALMHPDYAMPAPVQIRVYEDKLKIWNPAVLPEGWSLRDLLGEHSSAPFNPLVANTFFRAGEIEAWGRGIERIFQACKEAGTPEPQWRWTNNDLWMEFPLSAEYMEAIHGRFDRKDGTEVITKVTTEVTDPVADPVADPVDRLLAVLVSGPLAPSSVQIALALKHRPTFRANYLRPALNLGLVEMTLPDKPASRLQKYRLSEAGRARLQALTTGGKPP